VVFDVLVYMFMYIVVIKNKLMGQYVYGKYGGLMTDYTDIFKGTLD